MDNTITDVVQDSSPVAPVVTEQVPAPEVAVAPKGSQTPAENLYAALAEERRLRKEAEEQLATLTTTPSTDDDVFSDEGRAIKSEVDVLKSTIEQMQDQQKLKDLHAIFPALKDKSDEFDEYRKDFPRHKIENVAKLFLTEKGLLEVAPERKGLEGTSGGGHRDPSPSGMTADDVKLLRETNYRQYTKLLSEGKLNDIK